MTSLSASQIVPSAHALTLFRALPGGEGRAYTATTFPKDPWQGCEHFVRMGHAVGWLREATEEEPYGVLDVLDADGSIVQDFAVTNAQAFQQIKRKLNLVVESTDGE